MLDFLCYSPIDSVVPDLPKQGPLSFVRVVNLYYKVKKTDITFNGYSVFKGLASKKFSQYIVLPSGQCKINVYPSGKASPLIAGLATEFQPQMIYTVIIYDNSGTEILCISDTNNGSDPESSNIRLMNLDSNTQEASLSDIGGRILFEHVKYKDISGYIKLPSGKYTLKGKDSYSNKTLFLLQNAQMEKGWNYTIYITASQSKGNPALMLIDGGTYINKR